MNSPNLDCSYSCENTVKNNKRSTEKISFMAYSLVIFFALTILNKFKYGVGMSGVIVPILLFFLLILVEKKTFTFTKSHFYIILFWFLAACSTMLSDIVVPRRDIFTFLIFTLFFIFSTSINYNKLEIKLLIKSYVLIAFLSSLIILWNFLNDNAYSWKRYSLNVLGVSRDPNYVSAFILPAIALVFLYILFGKKKNLKQQLYNYAILIVLILGVLTTGSRAAFCGLGIILILSFLYYIIKINRTKMILNTLLTLLFFLILFNIFKGILSDSVITRFTDFENYSNDIRLIFWKKGLELFQSYPLLGAGMESANYYISETYGYHSHNLFLDILVGQGLIGVMLLGLIFIRFINVKNNRAIMVIIVLSFFMPLFFVNGFNTASFWTPMIFCQILSNFSRKNEKGIYKILE